MIILRYIFLDCVPARARTSQDCLQYIDGSSPDTALDSRRGDRARPRRSFLAGLNMHSSLTTLLALLPVCGAYTRLRYSAAGADVPLLNSAQIALIDQAAGQLMISWSESTDPSDPSDWRTYDQAVAFTVPGPITATERTTTGQACSNTAYFVPVTPTCLRGNCNLPSIMYTGANFNAVCYNQAYGLVHPHSSGNSQCDWGMDGQGFASLYLGLPGSGAGCHGHKDASGSAVNGGSFAAIALWVRDSSRVPPSAPPPPPGLPAADLTEMLLSLTQRVEALERQNACMRFTLGSTRHASDVCVGTSNAPLVLQGADVEGAALLRIEGNVA